MNVLLAALMVAAFLAIAVMVYRARADRYALRLAALRAARRHLKSHLDLLETISGDRRVPPEFLSLVVDLSEEFAKPNFARSVMVEEIEGPPPSSAEEGFDGPDGLGERWRRFQYDHPELARQIGACVTDGFSAAVLRSRVFWSRYMEIAADFATDPTREAARVIHRADRSDHNTPDASVGICQPV